MKTIICFIAFCSFTIVANGQVTADTVVVQLAKTSKLTFTMEDRNDLDLLQHYDFEALFEDILARLEEQDTLKNRVVEDGTEMEADKDMEWDNDDEENEDDADNSDDEDDEDDEDDWDDDWDDDGDYDGDDDDDDRYDRGERYRRIGHFFNADFGINNYQDNSGLPSEQSNQYEVRPWGSWYVALNSVYRTRFTNSFLVEWSAGISWYNFKFQDEETLLTREASTVVFTKDPRVDGFIDYNFQKSKLTVSYINMMALPMIEFGHHKHHKGWKCHRRAFRVGAGVYGGYRLGSYTKQVFQLPGSDDEKDIDHDSFHLNNLRYGVRLQFGIHETDFFFTYDLNTLFKENRGPELNAYSFGIIF